jgi:hypothetical protein
MGVWEDLERDTETTKISYSYSSLTTLFMYHEFGVFELSEITCFENNEKE